MSETEIRQIKQEYITDRIKESIDLFGSKPEHFAGIITTAVMVLALLISKVLQKARALSARLFEEAPTPIMRQEPAPIMQPKTIRPKQKEQHQEQPLNTMTQIVSEPKIQMLQEPLKPQSPPKPVMTADAAAYSKLYKIYKELTS